MTVIVKNANVNVGDVVIVAEGDIWTSMDHYWSWKARKRQNQPIEFLWTQVTLGSDLKPQIETAIMNYVEKCMPEVAKYFK